MYKYDTLLLKTLPSIHTHLVCEVGASCTGEGKKVVGTEDRARLLELLEGVDPSAEHGQGHRVLVEGGLATSSHPVLEKKRCMLTVNYRHVSTALHMHVQYRYNLKSFGQ